MRYPLEAHVRVELGGGELRIVAFDDDYEEIVELLGSATITQMIRRKPSERELALGTDVALVFDSYPLAELTNGEES